MALLEIRNLHAGVEGKDILKGVTLTINPGEVHAIMGPNGTGKSTLGNIIAGRDGYTITEGDVLLNGVNLLELAPEARALAGVFLAFQSPVEIPGVATNTFLKTMLNARRRARGEPDLDPMGFLKLVKAAAKTLGVRDEMLKRPLNVGFSGGEKKRLEMLQMVLSQPSFAMLDETDSGLDIDALKVVAEGVNALRSPERGFLIITHFQRLLEYVVPDQVHVFAGGRIVHTGGPEVAAELEARGYAEYLGAAAA